MRTTAIVAGSLILLAAGALVAWRYFGPWPANLPGPSRTGSDEPTATYVGARACAGCHAQEHAAWANSDHARAMQVASETTVLGDFADRRFAYGAITSTFFRREGRYMVRTGGPDGKLADFEIKYTFGVRPLQQYLIELPGAVIRYQNAGCPDIDAHPRILPTQNSFDQNRHFLVRVDPLLPVAHPVDENVTVRRRNKPGLLDPATAIADTYQPLPEPAGVVGIPASSFDEDALKGRNDIEANGPLLDELQAREGCAYIVLHLANLGRCLFAAAILGLENVGVRCVRSLQRGGAYCLTCQ